MGNIDYLLTINKYQIECYPVYTGIYSVRVGTGLKWVPLFYEYK